MDKFYFSQANLPDTYEAVKKIAEVLEDLPEYSKYGGYNIEFFGPFGTTAESSVYVLDDRHVVVGNMTLRPDQEAKSGFSYGLNLNASSTSKKTSRPLPDDLEEAAKCVFGDRKKEKEIREILDHIPIDDLVALHNELEEIPRHRIYRMDQRNSEIFNNPADFKFGEVREDSKFDSSAPYFLVRYMSNDLPYYMNEDQFVSIGLDYFDDGFKNFVAKNIASLGWDEIVKEKYKNVVLEENKLKNPDLVFNNGKLAVYYNGKEAGRSVTIENKSDQPMALAEGGVLYGEAARMAVESHKALLNLNPHGQIVLANNTLNDHIINVLGESLSQNILGSIANRAYEEEHGPIPNDFKPRAEHEPMPVFPHDDSSPRYWYMKHFPTDDMWQLIPPELTWEKIEDSMERHRGTISYEILGEARDSVVRNRLECGHCNRNLSGEDIDKKINGIKTWEPKKTNLQDKYKNLLNVDEDHGSRSKGMDI